MADLFRREAIEHRGRQALGGVTLVRPISFTFYVCFAVTAMCTFAAIGYWGTFSKKARVQGVLIPVDGITKIVSPVAGTVRLVGVREADRVNSDAVLFKIETERATEATAMPLKAIAEDVESRRASTVAERDVLKKSILLQAQSLEDRLARIDTEIFMLANEISSQQRRLDNARSQYEKLSALAKDKFVSEIQVQQKLDDVFDVEAKRAALERAQSTLIRERSQTTTDLSEASLRLRREAQVLNRAISSLSQETTENEVRRNVMIVAPHAGRATAILTGAGATVVAGQTLMSLLPKSERLECQLFAPSKLIGQIAAGQKVLLRYQAYPYQSFGQHSARVVSVSKVPISGQELSIVIPNSIPASEPLYRIVVALDNQFLSSDHGQLPLQAGMLVDADIVEEVRRIWQWILDPYYSLRGRFE